MTLPSYWAEFPDGVPDVREMVCDEMQVTNKNGRKETFHCEYPFAPPTHAQDFTDANAPVTNIWWFSDFDGTQAMAFHIVVTPGGSLEGWATY